MVKYSLNLWELIKKEQIARRFFVINSFDGALTILGIIFAAWLSGITDPKIVIISSIGAGAAMGVSGFYGAYVTERAERILKIKELEKHLLNNLKNSELKRRIRIIVFMVALVNGFAQVFSALIAIIPYFIAQAGLISINTSFYSSIIIILIIIFSLGMFIGKVSKERLLLSGLKTLLAGLVVGLIIFLLQFGNLL